MGQCASAAQAKHFAANEDIIITKSSAWAGIENLLNNLIAAALIGAAPKHAV